MAVLLALWDRRSAGNESGGRWGSDSRRHRCCTHCAARRPSAFSHLTGRGNNLTIRRSPLQVNGTLKINYRSHSHSGESHEH